MTHNYFDLFQLPQLLPVDQKQLNNQYQQLQKQYHPDNFALASDSEKAQAMQQSATINTAYQTLKNLMKAAQYLLSLQGIDTDIEQVTLHDGPFLQQQFELRETLDEIETQSSWDRLDSFLNSVSETKRDVESQLINVIAEQQWQLAQQKIYQLRYYSRLIEQIESLQDRQFEL